MGPRLRGNGRMAKVKGPRLAAPTLIKIKGLPSGALSWLGDGLGGSLWIRLGIQRKILLGINLDAGLGSSGG